MLYLQLLFEFDNSPRRHQPARPALFLLELRASLIAKRTLMPINKAGSPVAAQKIKSVDILLSPKLYFSVKRILSFFVDYKYMYMYSMFCFVFRFLPLEERTPLGFLAFLSRVTLKSWGRSFAAGGLYSFRNGMMVRNGCKC